MTTAFIGDSMVAYCDLPTYFPGLDAVNLGVGGETPAQVLERFPGDVLVEGIERVVIHCGTNAPYASSVPNIITMADMARVVGVKVLLCQIPPREWADPASNGADFNVALGVAAAANRFSLVDCYRPYLLPNGAQNPALFLPDTTHKNAAGEAVWAAAIMLGLRPLLAPKRTQAQRFSILMGATL